MSVHLYNDVLATYKDLDSQFYSQAGTFNEKLYWKFGESAVIWFSSESNSWAIGHIEEESRVRNLFNLLRNDLNFASRSYLDSRIA